MYTVFHLQSERLKRFYIYYIRYKRRDHFIIENLNDRFIKKNIYIYIYLKKYEFDLSYTIRLTYICFIYMFMYIYVFMYICFTIRRMFDFDKEHERRFEEFFFLFFFQVSRIYSSIELLVYL